MTGEWTPKTKAMDVQTVSTALSEENRLADEQCAKVRRGWMNGV